MTFQTDQKFLRTTVNESTKRLFENRMNEVNKMAESPSPILCVTRCGLRCVM
jgi:hypothetical protein